MASRAAANTKRTFFFRCIDFCLTMETNEDSGLGGSSAIGGEFGDDLSDPAQAELGRGTPIGVAPEIPTLAPKCGAKVGHPIWWGTRHSGTCAGFGRGS